MLSLQPKKKRNTKKEDTNYRVYAENAVRGEVVI